MNKLVAKRIIGLLLLVVVLHFVFSNFDVLNRLFGFDVEIGGDPEIISTGSSRQVVFEPLKIRENYFKEDFKRNLFLINISNIDYVEGNVTLTLICNRSDFFSVNKTETIKPGESHVFDFDTAVYRCSNAKYVYRAHDVRREIVVKRD